MSNLVVNQSQSFDVYIGRGPGGQLAPSPEQRGYWGNPMPLEEDSDLGRRKCILAYWGWLTSSDEGRERLTWVHVLRGKILGCFCAPRLCHGDILVSLANDGFLTTAARIRTTRETVVDSDVIVPRTYCPTCGAPK